MKKLLEKAISAFPAGHQFLGLLDLRKQYLRNQGWLNSYRSGKPVDASGNPIPWITYPCIHFLTDRLTSSHKVFEYGSGNSTLWLTKKVGSITSVEHDAAWYEFLKDKLSALPNVTYHYRSLEEGQYPQTIQENSDRYDVVIVDGRERVACAMAALESLSSQGVIIWDNAERPSYQEGIQRLEELGFRKLEFHGLSPINRFASITSIFYRPDNCLGI